MGRTFTWFFLGAVLAVSYCSGNGSGPGDATSDAKDCLGCDQGQWEQLAETKDLSGREAVEDVEVVPDIFLPEDSTTDVGDGTSDVQDLLGDSPELGDLALDEEGMGQDTALAETLGDVMSPFPDLSDEGKGCGEAMICGGAKGCLGPDDADCWAECTEGLSELAEWKLGLLDSCFETHCEEATSATASQCRQQFCFLTEMVCTGGQGNLSCSGVLECLMNCPPTDAECRSTCLAQASLATAVSAYDVIQFTENNTLEVWLLQCSGGNGMAGCSETQECFIGCGLGVPGVMTDPPCLIQCMKNSSPEAQEMWVEMLACCEYDVLFSLMVQCVGGNGQLVCGEVLDCMTGCEPSDPGCFYACLGQTSPDEVEAVKGYFECVEELCQPELMPNCPDLSDCTPICVGEEEPGDE